MKRGQSLFNFVPHSPANALSTTYHSSPLNFSNLNTANLILH